MLKNLSLIALFAFIFVCESNAQTTADSLLAVGIELADDGDYEQALEALQESQQLFLQEKDSVKWVEASLEYGEVFILSGSVQTGLDILLDLDNQTVQAIPDSLTAYLKSSIGFAYRQLEQYEKAQRYYLEGIEIAGTAHDSLLTGRLNNNISYTYLRMGNYETALFHQKKALNIYEELGETYRLSYVLNGIFLTMMDLGLYVQAEPYIRQSLAIRKELGNPDLLDIAYHNLAWNFGLQGKRDSSIIYYQKSLELSRMLQNPYDITQTLNNIGMLYERAGEYENALAYYNEALETNYQTERPVSIARNLVRLADVAIRNDDLSNAENFYREALGWVKNADSPQELAGLYLGIAELKIKQNEFESAKEYVEKARGSFDENHRPLVSRAYNVLGEIYYLEGELDQSLSQYRRVHDLYSDQGIVSQIKPAMNLARAYNRVGSDSAFVLANESFNLIDSIRTNVAGLTFRAGFFREYAGFYNEVASWYITQKNNSVKAFELVEAAKARVLMDELAETRQKVYESLDESALIKKQQKAKKIDRLYNQLEEAGSGPEAVSIRNELKDLEFEYQSILNEFHAKSSELKNFDYPEPVTLNQLQELLDEKTAVIEYAFTHNGVIRLVVLQDGISAAYLDSVNSRDARTFFTESVREFRQTITEVEDKSRIYEQGVSLHAFLVPAFKEESKASEIANLVIIPDGPLSYLPFEALSKNSRYLIEDFQVKYLPSASIYSFIQAPHRDTEFDLLALAGSGFESEESAAYPARSQASFASLPSTLLEVDSISVNFNKVKVLKNDDVTEATLKSHDLGNYRILHFATHANVDESNPFRSGLILSKKAEVESLFGEDGHLNSREISSLKLNADLVTLSACNTGMGKLVTGEGLLGLQRSFLSAGASSVMVSLWSVFDRSTSVFMSDFYRSMLAHQQEDYGMWSQTLDWFGMYEHAMIDYKTKAIRDAKLAMIDHPYYNHPVYWAPFILIGK
ncbi:CHAT domain-containing protein [Gracilimonas sp.]|uniref:CHAT domain-containing protein n=1 Tax=Gracilimonas sp. TaxID=1974203 RepID=UPI003BABB05F